MKEYLNKETYAYVKTYDLVSKDSNWIEIPEGCNIITRGYRMGSIVYFHWKSLDSDEFFLKDEKRWDNNFNETLSDFIKKNEGDVEIIWKRHTQPEELPFIDDEPKIETATGYQLDVVGKNTYGSRSRESGSVDYSMNENILNEYAMLHIEDEPESLNDQYAEIEQVRQQTIEATLAERQAQYGSFVGVANTTGALMAVIKNSKNGSTLPYAHEEALHMICSKIARIVNGDFNYRDNWHDIGGYSKLVEDLL